SRNVSLQFGTRPCLPGPRFARASFCTIGSVTIKLIAMDLDGTLLNSQSQMPEANVQAIAEAAARGIEMVIGTGRRYHSARLIVDALPCDVHLIVNNGSLIKSKQGQTHQRFLLPAAIARRVLEATPEFRSSAAVVFDRPREN